MLHPLCLCAEQVMWIVKAATDEFSRSKVVAVMRGGEAVGGKGGECRWSGL